MRQALPVVRHISGPHFPDRQTDTRLQKTRLSSTVRLLTLHAGLPCPSWRKTRGFLVGWKALSQPRPWTQMLSQGLTSHVPGRLPPQGCPAFQLPLPQWVPGHAGPTLPFHALLLGHLVSRPSLALCPLEAAPLGAVSTSSWGLCAKPPCLSLVAVGVFPGVLSVPCSITSLWPSDISREP